MQCRTLTAHPDTPCPWVRAFAACAARSTAGEWMFDYRIEGRLDHLRLPMPATAARTDALWRHTCFEAFLRAPQALPYVELNFAPSGEWAAYHFADYREGMRPVALAAAPRITCRREPDRLQVRAELALALPGIDVGEPMELALCAVLESVAGELSYWSPTHPPGRADFHHGAHYLPYLRPQRVGAA